MEPSASVGGASIMSASTLARAHSLFRQFSVRPTPKRSEREVVPQGIAPVLVLLTRDFIYGLPEYSDYCYFSVGGAADYSTDSDDAVDSHADGAERTVRMGEDVLEDSEDKRLDAEVFALKLMRHFIFALCDTTAESFKVVVATAIRIFARECIAGNCKSRTCVFKQWPDKAVVCSDLRIVDRLIGIEGGTERGTDTLAAVIINQIREFHRQACNSGNLDLLGRVVVEHMRMCSYYVSQSHPQGAFAQAFALLKSHMMIKGKFYGIVSREAHLALPRIDGTRPFFSDPEESSPETDALDRVFTVLTPHVYGFPETKKRRGQGGAPTQPPEGPDEPRHLQLLSFYDSKEKTNSVGGILEAIELGERTTYHGEKASSPAREGRVMLVSGKEIKLIDLARRDGGAGDRSEAASRTLSAPHTVTVFADKMYYPKVEAGSSRFDGGGEHSAADQIYQLKHNGEVVVLPNIDKPSAAIMADSLRDVPRGTGRGMYNTFRGFYAEHVFLANHPTDLDGTGVEAPNTELGAELEAMLAHEYVRWTASMTLPTVAAFFKTSKTLDSETYETAARLVEGTCAATAKMLQDSCVNHRPVSSLRMPDYLSTMLGNGLPCGITGRFNEILPDVKTSETFADVVSAVDQFCKKKPTKHKILLDAALLLKAAATFYPKTLEEFPQMMKEYADWRNKNTGKPPSAYVNELGADTERHRATLVLFGYFVVPGRGSVGIDALFHAEGEATCFGRFEVLPFKAPVRRGALVVGNDLSDGFFGYRVRGHLPHTLTSIHRLIILDAVKTHVDVAAVWADRSEAETRWLRVPDASQICTVEEVDTVACTVTVAESTDSPTTTLFYARHVVEQDFGHVVPPVFSIASELVFEASTRATRGVLPLQAVLHGVELLKTGDRVQFWTMDGAGGPCIVAARHWSLHTPDDEGNIECALLEGDGRELIMDIADMGTLDYDEITPALGMLAREGFIVARRERSTIIEYLYAPTSAGDAEDKYSGQGSGKSQRQQQFAQRILGMGNSEVVWDYSNQIEQNQFSEKGVDKLLMVYDELPCFEKLTSVHTKGQVTNEKHDARVKCKQKNVTYESFLNIVANGNEVPSEENEAENKQQRRGLWIRVFMPNFGRTAWWSYLLGSYMSVSPTILFGILRYLTRLAEENPLTPNELQDKVARPIRERFWNGQTPLYAKFLKVLLGAPIFGAGDTGECTSGESYKTLLPSRGKDAVFTSAAVDAAAREFVTNLFGGGVRKVSTAVSARNAAAIVADMKRMAAAKPQSAWSRLVIAGSFKITKETIRESLEEERYLA